MTARPADRLTRSTAEVEAARVPRRACGRGRSRTAGPESAEQRARAWRAAARAPAVTESALLGRRPLRPMSAFRMRIGQAARRGGPKLERFWSRPSSDRKRLDGARSGLQPDRARDRQRRRRGHLRDDGTAAAQYAGPAVVFSFVLAGLAAAVTALCYAELAAMIPAAGSTYSYAYAAFGVFLAWFIGWDLLLEYLFAASTVAVGWAGYAVSLLGIDRHPRARTTLANPPFGDDSGIVNLPAILIVAGDHARCSSSARASRRAPTTRWSRSSSACCCCSSSSARSHVDASNWTPFIPAQRGRLRRLRRSRDDPAAAGVVFFAYVGFDAVSTAAGGGAQPAAHGADRAARHGAASRPCSTWRSGSC